MPPKTTNWTLWSKMISTGVICCVGGPALVYYVTPSEEQLFMKYNPELQKRSLENRAGRQQDFDDFVGRLKEYSKSDKPIWAVAAADEQQKREKKIAEQTKLVEEIRARKEEIRKSGTSGVPGGSL